MWVPSNLGYSTIPHFCILHFLSLVGEGEKEHPPLSRPHRASTATTAPANPDKTPPIPCSQSCQRCLLLLFFYFKQEDILPISSKQGKLLAGKRAHSYKPELLQPSLGAQTQKSSCSSAGSTISHPALPKQGSNKPKRGCSEQHLHARCLRRGEGEGESTAGICFVFPSHLIMLIIRHKRTGVFSRHNLAEQPCSSPCWTGGDFATRGCLLQSS